MSARPDYKDNPLWNEAISLARENKIPIIVFDIHKSGAFAETMCGQGTFTIIKDEA